MDPFNRVDRALKLEGFSAVDFPFSSKFQSPRFEGSPFDGWYFGILQTKRGPVAVYLGIPDLSFTQPPSVWLSERPTWLKGFRPHLLPHKFPLSENLCYNDHGKFHLLAHEPDRAVLRVLKDAITTIDRIADAHTVIEDSKREMAFLWGGADSVICDVEPDNKSILCEVGIAEIKGRQTILVSHSLTLLSKKLGNESTVRFNANAIIHPEGKSALYLTDAGPPKTLGDIRGWLKDISKDTYDNWHNFFKSPTQFSKRVYWQFFRTNGQLIGFKISNCNLNDINGSRNRIKFIKKNIYDTPAKIIRVSAERMDTEYLVRRNLPEKTRDLRGLNILLVGCGTIGGYLAPALTQLGAGTAVAGVQGRLTLCDSQILTNQNIGRHSLGFDSLGLNKAEAIKVDLLRKRPGIDVEAIAENAESIQARFKDFHLIINATGFEPTGRRLSKILRAGKWHATGKALLHTWVEGRGGVTRALLEDSSKSACFDCMWTYSVNEEPKARHRSYSTPEWDERVSDGYATMTPFAVSASLSSTALAIDAILAWRSDMASPRFRSRSAEGDGIKSSFSNDLLKNMNCPTCSI